jgi:hypothetical protein
MRYKHFDRISQPMSLTQIPLILFTTRKAVKTTLPFLLLSLISTSALASVEPSYSCKATRWNPETQKLLECGEAHLSMDKEAQANFKACGLQVFSGAAWGKQCRGIHIAMGTSSKNQETLDDQTSVFFCANSAPKDFQLSLLPRSTSTVIDLECKTAND